MREYTFIIDSEMLGTNSTKLLIYTDYNLENIIMGVITSLQKCSDMYKMTDIRAKFVLLWVVETNSDTLQLKSTLSTPTDGEGRGYI